MTQQACEPKRLDDYLQGELSIDDESALVTHLDQCGECRAMIEARAGEDEAWVEVQELLSVHFEKTEFNLGDTEDRIEASDVATESSRFQARSVLESLGPTDDPEMLGRLGPYEVSGIVGSGGMGVVLKAQDRSLDRIVAIKVMAPHLASSGSARKRFAREAKAAAAVLHPNVIAIHSVATEGELPYLVMPYLRGESLQKRLDREGPLPVSEILRIGSQVAAGLAAAHAQGLVHRDVKPANILLEEGVERVALTDFGLARAVDDATMTRSGVIAGTPQYMSPEQARGDSVENSSDLFSLGSVLYAMCTGRAPFRAETTFGVLQRINSESARPIRDINPDVPVWLSNVVETLMSKHSHDRFESAEAVGAILESCLAHVQQPKVVPLPHSVAITTSKVKPKRLRIGVFAMITTAAVALASVLGLAVVATSPSDITGKWMGEGWGVVELQQAKPGVFVGTYTKTPTRESGAIKLKWSRSERRYNGTWSLGKNRFGKISVRPKGDENIVGAWTTNKKSESDAASPRLSDLRWTRVAETLGGPVSVDSKTGAMVFKGSKPDVDAIRQIIQENDTKAESGRDNVPPWVGSSTGGGPLPNRPNASAQEKINARGNNSKYYSYTDRPPARRATVSLRAAPIWKRNFASYQGVAIAQSRDGRIAIATVIEKQAIPSAGPEGIVLQRVIELLERNSMGESLPFEADDSNSVGRPTELIFSPDGKSLALGTTNGEISVFDTQSRKRVHLLSKGTTKDASGKPSSVIRRVTGMAFSPDSRRLAVCGDRKSLADRRPRKQNANGDFVVQVWDVENGILQYEVDAMSIVSDVAFSPDGEQLACSGKWLRKNEETGFLVLDAKSGKVRGRNVTAANGGTIFVAYSPKGKLLTGEQHHDNANRTTIRLWNERPAQHTVREYASHADFSADGSLVAVLCQGKSVRFLDSDRLGTLHEVNLERSINWSNLVVDSEAGRFVVAGEGKVGEARVELWSYRKAVSENAKPAASKHRNLFWADGKESNGQRTLGIARQKDSSTIYEIAEETGVAIDFSDDGALTIISSDEAALDEAQRRLEAIFADEKTTEGPKVVAPVDTTAGSCQAHACIKHLNLRKVLSRTFHHRHRDGFDQYLEFDGKAGRVRVSQAMNRIFALAAPQTQIAFEVFMVARDGDRRQGPAPKNYVNSKVPFDYVHIDWRAKDECIVTFYTTLSFSKQAKILNESTELVRRQYSLGRRDAHNVRAYLQEKSQNAAQLRGIELGPDEITNHVTVNGTTRQHVIVASVLEKMGERPVTWVRIDEPFSLKERP